MTCVNEVRRSCRRRRSDRHHGMHREVHRESTLPGRRVRSSTRIDLGPRGASCAVATRSSARLRIEKHPSGAGVASGSHLVHVCVAVVPASGTRPARATTSCSRRPMFEGRRRSVCIALRTIAAMASSPTSIANDDQSVSMSDTRPPGRTTRAISATAAPGSGSHCRVRSDRTASKESSGSARAAASPTTKRTPHGAALALARASRSISAETSTPTTSPASPRSSARASAASPRPHPTSSRRWPRRRSSSPRSHARSCRVAGHCAVRCIVVTSTGTLGSSSTAS